MPQAPVKSTPSYRVIDRRGQDRGGTYTTRGSSNNLILGSSQQLQRTFVPFLDKDIHRSVSTFGRRTLMSLGRWLFWNFPTISGAILEQAMFATENFQPQFYGQDKAWGAKAEEWLLNWERIGDIQGWPYDLCSYRNLLVVSDLREGDIATLLTQTPDGYPMIQVWPAHRIGSATGDGETVTGGPYDGSRICDGVIHDDYRRAIAYRILDEDANYVADVPASNMFLSFIPKAPDQIRGFSALASAVFDWQDLKESRYWELIAQKAAAAVALIENNETGDLDESRGVVKTRATHDSTTGAKATLDTQEISGGIYRYFRAGSQSELKAFSYDRPGANVMSYQDMIIRDAFQGMEWSYFFSCDPSKVGGAEMRVVVEKINRVTRKRMMMVIQAMRRIHGYAISKAIKLGLLPPSDEWWMWEYQLPAEITADKKYDSDVDIQELNHRMTSPKRACAKRGAYWEDVQDEWLDAVERLQSEAKRRGIDLNKDVAIPEVTSEAFAPQQPVQQQQSQENSDSVD